MSRATKTVVSRPSFGRDCGAAAGWASLVSNDGQLEPAQGRQLLQQRIAALEQQKARLEMLRDVYGEEPPGFEVDTLMRLFDTEGGGRISWQHLKEMATNPEIPSDCRIIDAAACFGFVAGAAFESQDSRGVICLFARETADLDKLQLY